ncbi:thioredoxin family protein [Candidatus Bipolaricaulota bacterium]|nr:thioredoxin family protein [Candidatus Bipolaricaulota bacterium]
MRLMRRLLIVFAAIVALAFSATAFAQDEIVSVSVFPPSLTAAPGETVWLKVTADIATGWHINAHLPMDELRIPTEIVLEMGDGLSYGEIIYPQPKSIMVSFSETPLLLYYEEIAIHIPIHVDSAALSGPRTIRGVLHYQACSDEICLPPTEVEFEAMLTVEGAPIVSAAPSVEAPPPTPGLTENRVARWLGERGLPITLAILFLIGLALNLTPCAYPMIPITIGYFSRQQGKRALRVLPSAVAYQGGIAVVYSLLGLVAALTGQLFGAIFQRPSALIGLAALILALSLSLFGLYHVRLPFFITRRLSARSQGKALGAFGMGMVAGISAAPCVAPVTIALLAFVGSVGDPGLGFLLFLFLSLGLGAPYLFLALMVGRLKKMPRAGEWMLWVERLFATILLGLALYIVSPLLPSMVTRALAIGLTAGGGIYLGWFAVNIAEGRAFRIFRRTAGIVALTAAVGILFLGGGERATIPWVPYTAGAVEAATAEGQGVLLYFGADWCAPCRKLDATTFADPAVIEASSRLARIKVDLTVASSPTEEAARKRFGVFGVPTIIIIDSAGAEVVRKAGFVGTQTLLQMIAAAED